MNPFKSVGARLSFALVAVVALALGLVYMIVVPSLRQRLIEAKLNQLENVMPLIAAQVSHTQLFDFTTEAPVWSGRADARVVVYTNTNPASTASKVSLSIFADSNPNSSVDLSSDPVAQRAANTLTEVSGTVHRGNTEWVEVARPVSMGGVPSAGFLLFSASLHDALANVATVQRRMLEAGLLALLLALCVGYGLAYLFARRIRRLEVAAERIAAGRFDQPVVDKSEDELGQLARAFDRMRLRLSQLERARREFIGNASHELRTPLFSLRGFLELMTDEELDEPTRREFLETMREQVDRLQRLAEDLLDLTRLDAGRMHIERRPIDLGELATDLHDEFRAVAIATGHELELDAREGYALGDEERVVRIGRALLENALKHTPPGARVSVRSIGSSLVVGDDGPGIPAEYAAQVFERFYRIDGARASGSGLGLAIARELAEAMGGTLELESTADRTVFTLRLPPARFPVETDGGADERFVPAGEARTPRDELATDATRLK
jgi:signal transduction histidine kinase